MKYFEDQRWMREVFQLVSLQANRKSKSNDYDGEEFNIFYAH